MKKNYVIRLFFFVCTLMIYGHSAQAQDVANDTILNNITPSTSTENTQQPDKRLSVHPNPVSTILFINAHSKIAYYSIADKEDQIVQQGVLKKNSINFSKLKSGTYTVKLLFTNGDIRYKKVVKD